MSPRLHNLFSTGFGVGSFNVIDACEVLNRIRNQREKMVILVSFYMNYISIIIKKAFDIFFLPCSEVGFLRDWQVGGS